MTSSEHTSTEAGAGTDPLDEAATELHSVAPPPSAPRASDAPAAPAAPAAPEAPEGPDDVAPQDGVDEPPPSGPASALAAASVASGTMTSGPAGPTSPSTASTDSKPFVQRPASAAASDEELPKMPARPVSAAGRRIGKVRKARLRLLRVEPWSVMKTAFVLSIAFGITLVVAVAALWSVVDAAGVLDTVGGVLQDLTSNNQSAGIVITDYVGFDRVVGAATIVAVVDVVLLTALATLFAFLYNLSASLLGGFEITLAEDD